MAKVMWVLAFLWTLSIGAALYLQYTSEKQAAKDIALAQVRTSFAKDMAYRLWAAKMGGLYVEKTGTVSPNPYLAQVADRDLLTKDGKQLTLINPAYMTRMVLEQATSAFGAKGKITSINPKNPQNAPDDWEKQALLKIQASEKEFFEHTMLDGVSVFRYLAPIVASESCFRCHSADTMTVGKAAGGISISIPDKSTWGVQLAQHRTVVLSTLTGLFLFGLGTIAFAARVLRTRDREKIQLLQSLQSSEAKYREMIQQAPIAYQTLDSEGRILSVNDAWLKMLGYAAADCVGKPFIEFVTPGPQARNLIELLGMPGLSERRVLELRHQEGHPILVSIQARVEFESGGQKSAIHCTFQDITEQNRAHRALEESERKFRLIAGNTEDVIFLYELANQRFEYVSPSVERITGYTPAQLQGHSMHEFLTPESSAFVQAAHPARIAAFIEGAKTQGSQTYEVGIRAADRRTILAEVLSTLLTNKDGVPTHMLGVCRDITKRKQYEEALNALLQETVSSSGDEFAAAVVQKLSHVLGVSYVLLGRLTKGKEQNVKTLALWANGRQIDNIEYHVKGAPCERLLEVGTLLINDELLSEYPESILIRQLGIRSYLGALLKTRGGTPLGVLVAMDTRSMRPTQTQQSLIAAFASRASTELERFDALEALAENEQRFRQTVQNSQAGYFKIGLDRRLEDVNQAWLDLHGYSSREEVLGKHFGTVQTPEHLPAAVAMIERILSGYSQAPGEFTRRKKDGSVGFHTFSASAVVHGGKITGVEGFIIDTTDLKKAKDEYAKLFNEMIDGFAVHEIICDEDGVPFDYRFLAVNPAFERIVGKTSREMIGKSARELFPQMEDFWPKTYGEIALKGGIASFERGFDPLGRTFAIKAFQSAPGCFACTVSDISNRIRAEQNLAKDEAELAAINEHVPMMLLLLDEKRQIRRYNRSAADFCGLGQSPEENLSPGSFLRCVRANDSTMGCGFGPQCKNCKLRSCFRDTLETGTPHQREETILHTVHGDSLKQVVLLFSTAQVLIGAERMVLLCIEDISQQKQAELQIRRQAALLDIARDAICVLSSDYAIEYWNRGAKNIFGWLAEEAVGCDWETLIFKQESPSFRDAWQLVLEKGEWIGELEALTKEGLPKTLQCRASRVNETKEGPNSVLFICTDITESRILEAQVLHMQRIDSLGAIASGIAHDLNNILSPILMSVDLLPSRMTRDDDKQLVEMLRSSAHRGADIVQQLLVFSRSSNTPRQPIDPARITREMSSIIRQTFPKSITLNTEIPDKIWQVVADSTQIHQVLLNLCVNARDAMEQGGALLLRLENKTLESPMTTSESGPRTGPHVCITVKDTGCGMPKEVLDRIFDPFFTTKPAGKGTGLGLSTVLGIIKAHNGFIRIQSEPGAGTECSVFLPAIPDSADDQVEEDIDDDLQGRGELILVIDDEESVQHLINMTLASNNYRVLHAPDGAKAVAMFSQRASEIRVAITDMMMPHMDGKLTIQCLRQINPRLPIIAMSGMHDQIANVEKSGEGGVKFLLKPFTVKKMLALLKEVLVDSEPSKPA